MQGLSGRSSVLPVLTRVLKPLREPSIGEAVEDLAERVERLEFWMKLPVHMVDPDVKPFSLVIMDRGFDRQRMNDILWCMDAYRARSSR